MKVCLLNEDSEWGSRETYYDTSSIIQDLGLASLFLVAAKRITYENGEVKKVEKEDTFIMETVRNTMMIPLTTEREILYRQAVIKDSLQHEELIRGMYEICCDVFKRWDELGRRNGEKVQQSNPVIKLVTDIRLLKLFCDALSQIKELLLKDGKDLVSAGLKSFRDDFLGSFSDDREEFVKRILGDISFYSDRIEKKNEHRSEVVKPRIILECGLEDGLKFSSMKLEEISSQNTPFLRPGSAAYRLQEFLNSRIPDSFSTLKEERISEQVHLLEYGIVSYLTEELRWFSDEFRSVFERLRFQTAFCIGAIQLTRHIERLGMKWCFPKICGRRDLSFTDLKEFVMGIAQRVDVVGNTCSIEAKDLLIITGANQGGKSTFLRSIGIAQVMMQCGLMVTAESYCSGIFPRIFVHFTRREDSAMNSGRLDEELGRMSRIVDQLGDGSLLLLNESFATTTEKEGSVIACDIVRALKEAGVRILTVTHLLSFARRFYEETKDDPQSGVEFFSAERREDGTRTFRMIRHEPELTSFGLDLYEEIVEKSCYFITG